MFLVFGHYTSCKCNITLAIVSHGIFVEQPIKTRYLKIDPSPSLSILSRCETICETTLHSMNIVIGLGMFSMHSPRGFLVL